MKPGRASARGADSKDAEPPRLDYWRPLPWQADLWLDLSALIIQQRLPQTLLLVGGAGIGKRWFARALVAYALCENRSGYACGQCRSCTQLLAGSHPNASTLSVEGHRGLAISADGFAEQGLIHWQPDEDRKKRDITIDSARSLMSKLTLASHYGAARFAIIEPADLLNVNSANALLKTVEEPSSATHLLLISERPQALPATLRSRCQRVRFPYPDAASAQAWMAEQGVRDADALAYALGAPLRAVQLSGDDGIGIRRQWQSLWLAIVSQRKDPLEAAAAIDKDSVAEHLQWAQYWLSQQLRQQLQPSGSSAAREALAQMLQDVIEAQRRSAHNAQPQLLLESLFTRWLRLGRIAQPGAAAA